MLWPVNARPGAKAPVIAEWIRGAKAPHLIPKGKMIPKDKMIPKGKMIRG
jgi:hypothetical protein